MEGTGQDRIDGSIVECFCIVSQLDVAVIVAWYPQPTVVVGRTTMVAATGLWIIASPPNGVLAIWPDTATPTAKSPCILTLHSSNSNKSILTDGLVARYGLCEKFHVAITKRSFAPGGCGVCSLLFRYGVVHGRRVWAWMWCMGGGYGHGCTAETSVGCSRKSNL